MHRALRLPQCLARPTRRPTLTQPLRQSRWSTTAVSTQLQYLSLYNYTPIDEHELPQLRSRMVERWSELRVLGRIYIAEEGINAQLLLPAAHVDAFADSFPNLFGRDRLNFGAVYEIQGNAGVTGSGTQLFEKLDIRIRKQIVADGFEKAPLNLQDTGNALSPDQWHHKLQRRNETHDHQTLVLDVRNFYEHDVGRFDGATRIMVDTFRDTFDAVDEILESHAASHNGAPPSEVMMYCTGGIRCEKVGAYLKQHKGIDGIHKLAGGIVKYQRFLKDHPQQESLFKGRNFVFDQRCVSADGLTEDVTSDVLGECFQCGEPCNNHTNCTNLMCHGLILQCVSCAGDYKGACSAACRDEVSKMAAMSKEQQRQYRKENAHLWKAQNSNAPAASAVKYVKFRPVPPTLQRRQLASSGGDH